jgi:hypothetical protein
MEGYPIPGDLRTFGQNGRLQLILPDQYKGGPDWSQVTSGDAIYAHVEPINEDLINIEYIMLYPFNRGLNQAGCEEVQFIRQVFGEDPADHYGDLTTMVLVYSINQDRIVRVTLTPHGKIILLYDLMNPSNLSTSIENLQPENYPALHVFTTSGYEDSGPNLVFRDFFSGCENGYQVWFAQDPQSGRYEHFVAYIEWGSHEVYSAKCGDACCMPSHNGLGPCFLPDHVTYLGTMSDMVQPNYSNAAFIFFSGKWGNDPDPAIVHREWYSPVNRCMNPCGSDNPFNIGRADDKDPYCDNNCNGFQWPPSPYGDCSWHLQPPTTMAALTGPYFHGGLSTYISRLTSITLSVTENPVTAVVGAGYAGPYAGPTTYYCAYPDGGRAPLFTDYLAPFTLWWAPDGTYHIDYYSVDILGNQETTESALFTLDTTAPVVAITQPTGGTYAHSATLTLSYIVNDGLGSGVEGSTAYMDGATTLAGHGLSSGQAINLLTELTLGPHALSVHAVDNVGNGDTTSVTFTIIVTAQSISGDVTQFVAAGKITQDEGTSLLSKLASAANAVAAGNCSTAAHIYTSFINEVRALSGKKIDAEAAQILVTDAQYLIDHCP